MKRVHLLLLVGLIAGLPSSLAAQTPTDDANVDEKAATADTAAADTPATDTPVDEIVDEIVVVARRREENLQEVPISMTAFDAATIDERLMVDITDVGNFSPNVTIGTTGGFGFQSASVWAMIRGIGQLSTGIGDDPGVGIYVDGIFMARANGGVFDLLDVERVEVLRGPQGTLFGKNTTGGAISIITKRPPDARTGRLSATFGRYDRRDVRASIAGPLTDGLQASLAVMSSNRDGYSRSLASGQTFHDDDRQVGRLALHGAPSDNVTIDFTADMTREREAGGNQILIALEPTPIFVFYNDIQEALGRPPVNEAAYKTGSFYESHSAGPTFSNVDNSGFSLDVNWTLNDKLALRSISSYRDLSAHFRGDQDTVPNVISDVEADIASHQVSQELHLSGLHADGRLNWVLGAHYFRERPRNLEDIDVMASIFLDLESLPGPVISPPGAPAFLCNPGPPPPGVPCFGGAGNPFNFAFYGGFGGYNEKFLETESVALFGEATWDAGEKLSLTFGARATRDDKSYRLIEYTFFRELLDDIYNENDWDAVTPRVSLAYQARPNVLVYTTVANGYKSGGFNGRPAGNVLEPYDPENVWSYETGWKSDLFGHKLRLNGAVFWNDYEDIHMSQRVDVDNVQFFLIQNAGKAETKGFELELTAYPVTGLHLTLAAGYTDAKLVEVDPGVAVAVADNVKLPKTPEWTLSAALQYAFDLGGGGALIARADYSYMSKVYNDLLNSPLIAQDAYGLLNARVSWTPRSGGWELSGFVTNLADETYLAHGIVAAGFGYHLGVAGSPRQWGLTAQWSF